MQNQNQYVVVDFYGKIGISVKNVKTSGFILSNAQKNIIFEDSKTQYIVVFIQVKHLP